MLIHSSRTGGLQKDYGEYEMPHSYKLRRKSRRTGHTPRKYEIRLPIYVDKGQSNACSNTKTDESLTISDNIEITVLEIGKDRVKIGISAPKDVKIIRNELRDAQDMNKESSQALPKAAMEALLGMKKTERKR